MKHTIMSVALIAAFTACSPPAPSVSNASSPAPAGGSPAARGGDELSRKIGRFAPTEIAADVTALPPDERQALTHMIRAAQVMDALFLEQVWAGNEAMLFDLLRDDTDAGRRRVHYFLINKGPWSRLDHNEAFIGGAAQKPASANYYPADATKDDVEKWRSEE